MRYFQTVVTARLGVAAAATFLALAAPASASTIDIEVDPSFDDDAAVYRAAPGEANQLTIGADPAGAFTFQDPGAAAVTPQAPCMSGGQPATFATCPNGTFVGIVANLGDGDDTASSGASVLSIPLILNGEDGRDRLLGSGAADLLNGGAGSDRLSGGDGPDLVDYSDRDAPVRASLDGVANDGESGEGDQIAGDVEAIAGGAGADDLTGDGGTNDLIGLDGDDSLDGGSGPDVLEGDTGDDVIVARDGVADSIFCGPGDDTVVADAGDVVFDCESVEGSPRSSTAGTQLPPAAQAPRPATAPRAPLGRDLAAPRLRIRARTLPRLRTALRRGLRVSATCTERCTVRVRIVFRRRIVARGAVAIAAAGSRGVTARFTPTARKLLRGGRRARLTIRATARDTAGNARTVSRAITLKR